MSVIHAYIFLPLNCSSYPFAGIDVYDNITLEFDGGRIASLHANGLTKTDSEAVIVGTNGFLKVLYMNHTELVGF